MKKAEMQFIVDLLTKLDSRLDDMHEVQIRHEENLKEHMRRSAANEAAINQVKSEVKPLKSFVDMAKGVGAFLGLLAVVASIWAAVK